MHAQHEEIARSSGLGVFAAELDDRLIECGAGSWTAQVTAVYAQGETRWLQLAVAEHPSSALLLRLQPGATLERVLMTLQAWNPFEADPQTVITVAPAAF
jgi:hypothetical protein